ncbi:MAG: CHASE2 domain-containing protein [Desulfobacterium sp.]
MKDACFFLYRPAFITFLDQKLYDVMHLSLTDRGTPQPVIVDINDQSLEAYGQWLWSRDLLVFKYRCSVSKCHFRLWGCLQ